MTSLPRLTKASITAACISWCGKVVWLSPRKTNRCPSAAAAKSSTVASLPVDVRTIEPGLTVKVPGMPILRSSGSGPWSIDAAVNVHNIRFMPSLLRNGAGDSKRAALSRHLFSLALIFGCAVGCGSPAQPQDRPDGAPVPANATNDPPEVLLYEQLRSGAYQLN